MVNSFLNCAALVRDAAESKLSTRTIFRKDSMRQQLHLSMLIVKDWEWSHLYTKLHYIQHHINFQAKRNGCRTLRNRKKRGRSLWI